MPRPGQRPTESQNIVIAPRHKWCEDPGSGGFLLLVLSKVSTLAGVEVPLKKRLMWLDSIKGNREENAGIPSSSFKDNNRKTGVN